MFIKGDVVVAKDEFLEEGETLKDSIGLVLDYNPKTDYLLLGVLHPEEHVIPPSFSMRGCFYRNVTNQELQEWGIVKEKHLSKKSSI